MKSRNQPWDRVIAVVSTLTLIAYPFLIYFGLAQFEPWVLYVVVGGILLLRGVVALRYVSAQHVRKLAPLFVSIGVLLAGGAYFNNETLFLLIPGLLSIVGGYFFGRSLFVSPSMIETFARMSISDITEKDVRYCWNVTLMWTVFFVFNAAVIFYLVATASLQVWTIYTGGIAYALMGMLFAGEFLFRVWKFRRYRGFWFDPFLRWLFPPRGNVTATFIPLRKLMVQGRSESYSVAKGENGTRDWHSVQQRVAGVTNRLLEIQKKNSSMANEQTGRWLLTCDNTVHFCTGLLAIWQANAIAVLPPNPQDADVNELVDTNVLGVVTDRESVQIEPSKPEVHPGTFTSSHYSFDLLDPDQPAVELFTSGTTGERTGVVKNLSHLQDEIRTLEECWRERLEGAEIFATVSHQHIYGMLFRALWPLSAGRVFDERSRLYPAELEKQIAATDEEHVVLVSSPAHLKRLMTYELSDDVSDRVETVFSSGGPLPAETAEQVRDQVGTYPVEVLGSTETGGVAWRTRGRNGGLWTPFDPVEIEDRGTLHVRSPFVSAGGGEWFGMGDRVEIRENGFELKGRADRVVNIAEKRLSLPKLESALEDQEQIRHAAALTLERRRSHSSRTVVAAAIVLSDCGNNFLEKHDRSHLIDTLRNKLMPKFDAVQIPRLWRFVDELPRDAQGKVPEQKLNTLFHQTEEHQEVEST